MNCLQSNIRYLRRSKDWTQEMLGNKLNVKRSTIGAWEESRSNPRLPQLIALSQLFSISTEDLLKKDLSAKEPVPAN